MMSDQSLSKGCEYVTTEGQLADVLERMRLSHALAVTLETTGPDPFVDQIRTLHLAVYNHPVAVIDYIQLSQRELTELHALLETPITKVMHGGKIALKFLYQAGFSLSPPYFDTMLASQLLKGGIEGTHDLRSVAHAYLHEEILRRCSNPRADTLTEQQIRCVGYTAQVVLALYAVLLRHIEKIGLITCMRLECDCIPAVAAMELCGMLVDKARWQELQAMYNRLEGDLANEVCHHLVTSGQLTLSGVAALNLGSPQQMKHAFRSVGVPVRNVREDELLKYEKLHPAVPSYLRYKHVLKVKNGFLDALPRHIHPSTGRIHPTFLQIGTVNGRFACRDPNLQQIPRDDEVRGCFVAASDHCLIIADYAQFELRVVADISGDHTMTSAFQQGQDLHRLTASLVLDTPIDQVTKEGRLIAKVLNIGLIYGMGARSLRRYANYIYGVHFTLEDAIEFRTRFFDAYAGLRAFHRSMDRSSITSVRTLSGRIRRWMGGEEPKLTELLNTRVQGTAADIMKRALSLLHGTLEGTEARIICCVHDELLVETPLVCAPEIADTVSHYMRTAGDEFLQNVPLDVDVTTATSWADKQ
ncbi:MAG: DNA polymerase [Halobacteriota archaeon]